MRLSQLSPADRERIQPTSFAVRPQPIRVLDIMVHEPPHDWQPTGILMPDGTPDLVFVGVGPIGFLHDIPRGRTER